MNFTEISCENHVRNMKGSKRGKKHAARTEAHRTGHMRGHWQAGATAGCGGCGPESRLDWPDGNRLPVSHLAISIGRRPHTRAHDTSDPHPSSVRANEIFGRWGGGTLSAARRRPPASAIRVAEPERKTTGTPNPPCGGRKKAQYSPSRPLLAVVPPRTSVDFLVRARHHRESTTAAHGRRPDSIPLARSFARPIFFFPPPRQFFLSHGRHATASQQLHLGSSSPRRRHRRAPSCWWWWWCAGERRSRPRDAASQRRCLRLPRRVGAKAGLGSWRRKDRGHGTGGSSARQAGPRV